MYIKKSLIQNFKGIENLDIEFSEGINLIIGNNGAGKTSILSAIAQALDVFVNNVKGNLAEGIAEDDIRIKQSKIGEVTYSSERCFPVVAKSELFFNNQSFQYGKQLTDTYIRTRQAGYFGYDERKEFPSLLNSIYPLISFQRFDREWKLSTLNNSGQITIKTGVIKREEGYDGCLFGVGQEEIIQQWCLKMSMMEFEKKSSINEFTVFKALVAKFLNYIENDDKDYKVYYSTEFSSLVFDDGNTCMPIYNLSTGYRALLSMVMELSYRAVTLNPNITSDNMDIPGVVLIDEIDAHLHPKWQWKVLGALEFVFPNVQFIIATHSPIILSSAKNATIINIENNSDLDYLDSAYGFTTDNVLTLRQGTLEMPEQSRKYIDDVDEALSDNDLDKAEKLIDQVKQEYGEESIFYKELYQFYQLNSLLED